MHACGALPHHMSAPPLTSQLLLVLLLLQASEGGCCSSEGCCTLILLCLLCRRRRPRVRRCALLFAVALPLELPLDPPRFVVAVCSNALRWATAATPAAATPATPTTPTRPRPAAGSCGCGCCCGCSSGGCAGTGGCLAATDATSGGAAAAPIELIWACAGAQGSAGATATPAVRMLCSARFWPAAFSTCADFSCISHRFTSSCADSCGIEIPGWPSSPCQQRLAHSRSVGLPAADTLLSPEEEDARE